MVKGTVKEVGLIENVKRLLTAVRDKGIQIIYAPHRQTQLGDYMNWKFLSPSQAGSKAFSYQLLYLLHDSGKI